MKKVFLALMAVAAIALTSCQKNPSVVSVDYAKLCDEVLGKTPAAAEEVLTKAGWVKSETGYFVQKNKEAALKRALEEPSSKNLLDLGAAISIAYGEDKCLGSEVEYYVGNLKSIRAAIVGFADHAYNHSGDNIFYNAFVNGNEYKEHAAFIEAVKNSEIDNVKETCTKYADRYVAGGSKIAEDGSCYVASYHCDHIGD